MSDVGTITYATQQRVIGAGVESAFDVTAAYVACISASHTDFDARFNDGPVATFAPGLHVGGGGVPKTQKVSIRNTHPTDSLTIEIAYGIGQFFDRRLALPDDAIKVQPTAANPFFRVRGEGANEIEATSVSVASGAAAVVSAGAANVAKRTFYNGGAGAVWLRDDAVTTAEGVRLEPGEKWSTESTASVAAFNDAASAVKVHVLTERWT